MTDKTDEAAARLCDALCDPDLMFTGPVRRDDLRAILDERDRMKAAVDAMHRHASKATLPDYVLDALDAVNNPEGQK